MKTLKDAGYAVLFTLAFYWTLGFGAMFAWGASMFTDPTANYALVAFGLLFVGGWFVAGGIAAMVSLWSAALDEGGG